MEIRWHRCRTALLKEINTGNANADSSNPHNFYPLNGSFLFTATDATHGEELWKTDGTAGGTVLVKDINPGSGSSASISFFGFEFPLFWVSIHSTIKRISRLLMAPAMASYGLPMAPLPIQYF